MSSMYIAIDDLRRRIFVEPSFPITDQMADELTEIHSISTIKATANRLVMRYTYGFELDETLAAIIYTMTWRLPSGFDTIATEDEELECILSRAIEIANIMNLWGHLDTEADAIRELIAEIDARAARYDEDARDAASSVKYWRERIAKSGPEAYGFYEHDLNASIAKRRLVTTNKRHDPKRREKAQARLSELETAIRKLRPAYRKLVRPELQALV